MTTTTMARSRPPNYAPCMHWKAAESTSIATRPVLNGPALVRVDLRRRTQSLRAREPCLPASRKAAAYPANTPAFKQGGSTAAARLPSAAASSSFSHSSHSAAAAEEDDMLNHRHRGASGQNPARPRRPPHRPDTAPSILGGVASPDVLRSPLGRRCRFRRRRAATVAVVATWML